MSFSSVKICWVHWNKYLQLFQVHSLHDSSLYLFFFFFFHSRDDTTTSRKKNLLISWKKWENFTVIKCNNTPQRLENTWELYERFLQVNIFYIFVYCKNAELIIFVFKRFICTKKMMAASESNVCFKQRAQNWDVK